MNKNLHFFVVCCVSQRKVNAPKTQYTTMHCQQIEHTSNSKNASKANFKSLEAFDLSLNSNKKL